MKTLFQLALKRAKERSSWIGLAALLSALGVTLSPEMTEAVITAGIAAAGLIAVLFPDNGRAGE